LKRVIVQLMIAITTLPVVVYGFVTWLSQSLFFVYLNAMSALCAWGDMPHVADMYQDFKKCF